MILGIGTDIVDVRRIKRLMKRFDDRFLNRVFTDAERAGAMSRGRLADLYFAKSFAAKEAVYKALSGSGVDGMGWRDVETTNLAGGAPKLLLTGLCKTALERLAPEGYKAAVSLSLSDEPPYAVAFVVISAQGQSK